MYDRVLSPLKTVSLIIRDYDSSDINKNVAFLIYINNPVLYCPSQVYTASNPNGTTAGKTFKVHLQLWDTAGQER